nr:hypothetical protein [Tanacetum cinerariifolium]
MLESKAYNTYCAFATREKTLKPKYIRKKADSDTSPKQKPVQATKGTRLKTKAKVAKSDKKKQPAKIPKAKGLDVLSKVALTEAKQLKVPDEKHLKTTGSDEGTDKSDGNDIDKSDGNDDDDGGSDNHDGDSDDERMQSNRDEIPGPNLTNVDQAEHEEEDVNERVHTPSDYELADDEKIHDEENINEEERIDEEEEDGVTKGLYKDKTDEPVQSSFVFFDFTSKLLNLKNLSPTNNEIASLMETSARHATAVPKITSSFTTISPPPHPFFNPLLQQATPTPTPTTFEVTTLFPSLLDFSSIFSFNDRVINLEKDPSELKQVDQEEVKTQLPKILPKAVSAFVTPVIERNVIESLEASVLERSSSQPKSTYKEVASLSEYELTRILLDKMDENKSHLRADYKRSFMLHWSSLTTRTKIYSIHMEPSHTVDDSRVQQDQVFDTGNNDEQPADKEISLKKFSLDRLLKGTCKSLTELEYHLEECSKATTEKLDWHNPEGKPYPFDISKPLPLTRDHRGRQVIPQDFFINNDLECLKGGDLRRRYSILVMKTKAAT